MRIDNDGRKIIVDKNYQIARFISLLIGLHGLFMTFVGFREENNYIITLSLSYSIAMFISLAVTQITKKPHFFYALGAAVVLALEINFILKGGTEGFGIIWMILIPLFSVYLFSFPIYIISSLVYFLLLVLFMWTPLSQYAYPFKPSFMSRFPSVYFIEAVFGAFLQKRIKATEIALQAQKKLLEKEIKQAELIQKSFYNVREIKDFDWNIAYKSKPMAGVSGDLYDFYQEKGRFTGFGIYDISGHGISSGILTLLAKNIISQEFTSDMKCPLWETVTRINNRFIEEKGEVSNYITGITGRILNTQIEIVNAAHPSPLLYHKKENTFEFVKNNPNAIGPIGLVGIPALYESINIHMESGDELILYTDGLLEIQNKKGDLFGEENLLETIKHNISKEVEEQKDSLYERIKDFRGNAAATDDVTFIIIQKS